MQDTASIEVIPIADTHIDAPRLQAIDLCCVRGDLTLFRDLNFTLETSEVLEVQGPNGCGKTSLLQILCGLGRAELGDVLWRGTEIHEQRSTFAAQTRYIGHSNGCKLDLSPTENLHCLGALNGMPPGQRVAEALDRAGLEAHAHVPLRRLSAGQRRRTALARLLLDNAPLWILDEPFTALDVTAKRTFADIIAEHGQTGGITVLTAHGSSGLTGQRRLVMS